MSDRCGVIFDGDDNAALSRIDGCDLCSEEARYLASDFMFTSVGDLLGLKALGSWSRHTILKGREKVEFLLAHTSVLIKALSIVESTNSIALPLEEEVTL